MLTLSSVYEQYFPLLNAYVQKKVGDRFVAHDIVTDVILKVVNRYPDLPEHKVKVALLVSVRNKCWDWERSQKGLKKEQEQYEYLAAGDQEDFERAEIRADLLEYMESFIKELPPACQKIFLLNMEGAQPKEICNRLKMTNKTVRNQLSLARGILRRKIRMIYQ